MYIKKDQLLEVLKPAAVRVYPCVWVPPPPLYPPTTPLFHPPTTTPNLLSVLRHIHIRPALLTLRRHLVYIIRLGALWKRLTFVKEADAGSISEC